MYDQTFAQQMLGLILLLCLVGCSAPTAFAVVPPTATLIPPTPTEPPPTATVAPSPTPDEGKMTNEPLDSEIVYAKVGEKSKRLDVYAPGERGPWPVVIVAHGLRQTRLNFEELAAAIAAQGAVVYNIDVPFSIPFSTGIQCIACAVRFARATAADYGGDPGRIVVVGNSVGACTGAVVALAGDDFGGDCVATDVPGRAETSALPDAFVGFEGPYDYAIVPYSRFSHTHIKARDPELWQAINPYSHIGRNPGLKVRLIHGDKPDTQWYDIPLEASREFGQALADAGYDAELIVVKGASHTALKDASFGSDAFAVAVQQVMVLAQSLSPGPTAAMVPPTGAPVRSTAPPEPTSCDQVDGKCLQLSFDGKSCTYEGPTELAAGPVVLIYVNASAQLANVALNQHTGEQTIQDAIDHFGEAPSPKPCPSWRRDIVRTFVLPGVSYSWEGELEEGIYHMVCYQQGARLKVWFGTGLTVIK